MSAISDDIDHYEWLCERYGEEAQYSHGSADCYGKHADELKWKLTLDKRAERGMTYDYRELCERFGEEPRTNGGKVLDISGWYAQQLEDRARKEDGKPPRKEDPNARATSYPPEEDFLLNPSPKTRFDRIK